MTDATYKEALEVVGSLGGELSPPSVVVAATAIDAAMPLLQAGADIGTQIIGEVVGEAVGQIAGAIPVVGFFVSIATGIIKLVGASAEQRDAEKRAECQEEFQRRRVIPSGSKFGGCEQCPCDLFRLVGPKRERSLIGQALIQVTEGSWLVDEDSATIVPGWTGARVNEERYRMIASIAGTSLSKKRRSDYRKLRVAMQAAYVEPGARASDAGVSLWPAYLDMILSDIDAGRITSSYVDLCISAAFFPKVAGKHSVPAPLGKLMPPEVGVLGANGALVKVTNQRSCYVPALRDAFFTLAAGWRDSVRPRYEQGKQALREIEAVANALRPNRGGLIPPELQRPSLLRFVLGTAAVGALGVGIARPALALAAARRAAGLARRAGGAVRSVVTRG